jgi:Xaa-Pro aminopeptidase
MKTTNMFSADTYAGRRARLCRDMGGGLLLFIGNDECGMNYADNTYRFRQDSTFLYFFGLDRPGLAAVIDIDEGREIVFGDEATIDDVVWTGPLPTLRDECARAGISQVAPAFCLEGYLHAAAKKNRQLHYLPPYRGDHRVRLFELLGVSPAGQEELASSKLARAVVAQRAYKSDEEVRQIEEAVNLSADMHAEAARVTRPGTTEAEVVAAVTAVAIRGGGDIAFPVIATVNGQVLHNHGHGEVAREGQLFLVDAGAENAMHYAGDLSSTFPVGRRFTGPQRVIYEIALCAHRAAVDALAPGVPFKEVHLAAAAAIFDGMKEIGLTQGDTAEAVQAGAHALFFPCGTGHMMGLDVHDMENLGERWVGHDGAPASKQFGLKSLRLSRPLEPGFVLTIEPGIYFIPELIERWRAEKHLEQFICYDKIAPYVSVGGLRNEEDYLITPDGKRRLGRQLPLTVDEVERNREIV